METNLLSVIIFAPLAGAAINWFVGRRVRNERFVAVVACGAVAVSAIVAFYLALKSDGALRSEQPILDQLWTWIQVGRFRADFGLAMDRLSGVYALFVTFTGFLIHVFAVGYMHEDKGFYRFFAFLNLFMFAMLTLVLADNFLLMFVGWEGVGLCSYLLIGYYTDKKEAGDAAKKAFITNRVGDWGFVLGVLMVFFIVAAKENPSISFFDKPLQGVTSVFTTIAAMPADPFSLGIFFVGTGTISAAALLLFVGATGKSAQIPLYVWLPDAMAGPTPVSALIHAATMVTAGIYLIVRCSTIFSHAPTAMFVVAVIGALTAIFAATIGLAQNDIKKVLAYSTISQLGYMFLACGVGAWVAAIFHVVTHAFFKALLFLGSGSVIHGMHHEQDMRRMGGLRKLMPVTFFTMLAGWLAICGVPFFAGFFSKDEILWKTWSAAGINLPSPIWSKVLWAVGAITALLTAIYMTRMMVMTFWGEERFRKGHDSSHDHDAPAHHHEPHESPWIMTVPLIVLAVLSTFAGFLGVPYAIGSFFSEHPTNVIERTLEPVVHHQAESQPPEMLSPPPQPVDGRPALHPLESGAAEASEIHSAEEVRSELLLAGVSVLIALSGIAIGFYVFLRRPLLQMPRVLENKYYVDEIYDTAIIHPIETGSREGLWKILDVGVIDGLLQALGDTVTEAGRAVRYLQAGFVRTYAAIILVGALIIIGIFVFLGR